MIEDKNHKFLSSCKTLAGMSHSLNDVMVHNNDSQPPLLSFSQLQQLGKRLLGLIKTPIKNGVVAADGVGYTTDHETQVRHHY